MGGFFYILASGKYKTLYARVTNDISRRIAEHRDGKGSEFTKRYGVHMLVYCEEHERIEDAIAREKQVKKWERNWKVDLIESTNPEWRDLYNELL
jgi:putative endonuclease